MNTLLATLCSHLNLKPEHTALLQERDTSDIWRQFAIWLLVDEEHGVIRFTNPGSLQYNAILQVADLYIDDYQNKKVWKDAEKEARAVAESIRDEGNIFSAVYSAVCAACCAAYFNAGLSAGLAATAYGADAVASNLSYYDAYDAHFERMVDKLIELLQEAPMITTNK